MQPESEEVSRQGAKRVKEQTSIRLSVVIHWLIFAFSSVGILGMAVPNCMQTVSFGEALRHMKVEREMLKLLLIPLSQVCLIYAYHNVATLLRIRILIALGAAFPAMAFVAVMHDEMANPIVMVLLSPIMPFHVARGAPGIVWAEGYVISSACGLWVLLWTIIALTEILKTSMGRLKRGRPVFPPRAG